MTRRTLLGFNSHSFVQKVRSLVSCSPSLPDLIYYCTTLAPYRATLPADNSDRKSACALPLRLFAIDEVAAEMSGQDHGDQPDARHEEVGRIQFAAFRARVFTQVTSHAPHCRD